MSGISIESFFAEVKRRFYHFSLEKEETLRQLLGLEENANQFTFVCSDGEIIAPEKSLLLSKVHEAKKLIKQNSTFIRSVDFLHNHHYEYFVQLTYAKRHRFTEEDLFEWSDPTGEEYSCLTFKQLILGKIYQKTVFEPNLLEIDFQYRINTHSFLEDKSNGFTILEKCNNKFFPLSGGKSLTYMDQSCMPIFRQVNPFIVEMMKEKDQIPFTWIEIVQARNKYDLLCKKYPKQSFSKKVNKYPLRYTYALQKIQPRVSEKQFRRISASVEQNKDDIFPSQLFHGGRKNSKDFCIELLVSYVSTVILSKDIKEEEDDVFSAILNHYQTILRDYLSMSFELKEKVEFNFRTAKGLERNHDLIVRKYNLRKAKRLKDFKLKQHEKYNRLKKHLKKNPYFTLIKTNKELFLEGVNMHHCVYSYLEKIQRGESIIWKYERQEHRYTVEIKKRKNGRYRVVQCYGKYDSFPDREELERIVEEVKASPYK
ncbi:PcfJ domain-containing protein [Enterococcus faecium]|uniref:PcfJ domain-containing protein n=1 Tax=Enterococcus faecium TaxID=1352 RepID=A0A9X3XVV3_ENTFC|nr:PcfJ domain-containing protein [Enterococcus faecium]MDC4247633.1 PcfJ domain-containing protein [Enterococcus faecium]